MRGGAKRSGATLEEMKQALEGKLYIGKKIKKIVYFREGSTGPVQKNKKTGIVTGVRWLNYEAQMETDVFLYPPWFAALGGGILRDTTGAVRISMGSGESRQQDDVLSDFRHGDCLCNR